tara:strand:+ start:186 stop:410 length:225 start_codon:yes stop_codon:yes gene_type:complete
MRNLFCYYLAILCPAIFIFWLKNAELIASNAFLISIFSYALLYRPFLDGMRLYHKGCIKKDEVWKIYIPFNTLR